MVGDWNSLKYRIFACFCTVIVRCTETFDDPVLNFNDTDLSSQNTDRWHWCSHGHSLTRMFDRWGPICGWKRSGTRHCEVAAVCRVRTSMLAVTWSAYSFSTLNELCVFVLWAKVAQPVQWLGYGPGVWFQVAARCIFLLHGLSDELWNGFGLSLKDSGDETSRACSKPINSYPEHIYMVRCLIKHMESFHLFVIYLTTLSAADIV